MKIVNIIGGLGNQMLEYAFAIALKQHHPDEDILLDISHFRGYDLHNGYEIDRIFGCQLPVASRKEINSVSRYMPNYKLSRIIRHFIPNKKTEIVEDWKKTYGYFNSDLLLHEGNAYFDGYWHSPRYYSGVEDRIKEVLTFPLIEDENNKKIAELISSTDSICIHIRRGDYVGHSYFEGICTEKYYMNALEEATKRVTKPVVFVFSNDIEYCIQLLEKYKQQFDIHFVNFNHGKDSYRDMQLMTLSKINIIANSTFSWWGAWLNRRPDNLTFCPERWVNYSETPDIYPDSWVRIPENTQKLERY